MRRHQSSSGSPTVSRKTDVSVRSMFSSPESSRQRAYAHSRQSAGYNYAARQTNPLQQTQRGGTQMRSAFGGSATPGSSTVLRPNMATINQQTGRQRSFAPQGRQQSRRGSQRAPMMSMSDMNNFIRSQPGGRMFMEDSDRYNGGRYNFEQSLSRTGAGMAKNGHLPPELQQMAIPFKPSRQSRDIQVQREQYWKTAGEQPQKPRSWFETQQASFIQQTHQAEQNERSAQNEALQQQAEMENALRMGVPFRRAAAPQQQQRPAATEQQARPRQSVVRVRRPPPTVRLVESTQTNVENESTLPEGNSDDDADRTDAPAPAQRVGTNAFIEQMQATDPRTEAQKAAMAACADGSCPTAHISDPLKLRSSALFSGTGAPQQTIKEQQQEQPSALFEASLREIQSSVGRAVQHVQLNDARNSDAAPTVEMPTIPVSKTKRRAMQPEVTTIRDGDEASTTPTPEQDQEDNVQSAPRTRARTKQYMSAATNAQ